ncbi:MAG: YggS family pyridoxal phosphate-dependent enzyme [Moraxella sp.]|nr:YggS family pyridoxal phosphate-dependent enzyme [Moraxella sp.]
MTIDNPLISRYHAVKSHLDQLNHTHHAHATLIAVSKTHSASAIGQLATLGQRDFGENYLQESLPKIHALKDLGLTWHYIGHIQRNKTRDIATHFDWVQTVERDIIAKRLNDQRPDDLPPLNVLIQLNIDDETNKSGCQTHELNELINTIIALPRLTLRGLMIIPAKEGSDAFARTADIFDKMKEKYDLPHFDTLSMGMSGDMADAVAHGSTMVRVGTAIFGQRDYPVSHP